MILCISGDKDCEEYSLILEGLIASKFTDVKEIVSGNGKGVEALAKTYAREVKIRFTEFKVDWKTLDAPGAVVKTGAYGPYNAKAPALRDDEMCEYADAFLLIEGANNKNIINNAKKMNKPCYIHTVTKEYEYVF